MGPLFGSEMSKARAGQLVAEAASDGRTRPARRAPRQDWRVSIGIRLVSAGFRLIEGRG